MTSFIQGVSLAWRKYDYNYLSRYDRYLIYTDYKSFKANSTDLIIKCVVDILTIHDNKDNILKKH